MCSRKLLGSAGVVLKQVFYLPDSVGPPRCQGPKSERFACQPPAPLEATRLAMSASHIRPCSHAAGLHISRSSAKAPIRQRWTDNPRFVSQHVAGRGSFRLPQELAAACAKARVQLKT